MSDVRLRYKTMEMGHMDVHIRMLKGTLQFQGDNNAAKN